MGKIRKVLVCITPQSNSKRLIAFGHSVTQRFSDNPCELHILHVEIGHTIFMTDESPVLLQELFTFGSGLGGIVHSICSEDVAKTIKRFIQENKITDVVVGSSPPERESFHEKLKLTMPYLMVYELPPLTNAESQKFLANYK